jgi:hypothetical protein
LGLLACSSEPSTKSNAPSVDPGCIPGGDVACPCSDGTQGVQTCDLAGALSQCRCASGMPLPATGGSAAPTGTGGTPSAGAPSAGAPATGGMGSVTPEPPENLAAGIRIREIAFYQAVKVALMTEGQPVIERNAPVIVGKPGLLRVSVEPLAGFVPREIVAELSLLSGNGLGTPKSVTQQVSGPSSDATLASTINFEIEGGEVTNDTRYALALRETGMPGAGTVDPGARFPATEGEHAQLGARDAGPLRVMVVPYRYNADGSGRLPVTTDEELQSYRDSLHALYPVSHVEIELHAPVDYDGMVGPQAGWSQWLDFHCALRTMEMPDPKVLYYGTIAPVDGWREYGGGVVGISPVPSPAGNYGRCSVGIGFEGGAGTMAHELGHSLGLPHAPCGTDGGPFPYPEASIGVWGYGLVSKMLKDPASTKDLMSYCDPTFISDFNYQRLFERIRYLNLQFDVIPSPRVRYDRVLFDVDGSVSVAGTTELDGPAGGPEEARSVTRLDAEGRSLGEATAYYFPFSEAPAGLWLVPSGARKVQLGSTLVELP